ncbi:MAG: DUF6141 family protein [Bacteroidales bacterium]|jgi:hypothetical protein|nr:DUF6141 family protein [Bacteroidales bacterium]
MKLHFSEKQSFRNVWILVGFILINGLTVYGLYQQVLLGKPWGNNPMSNSGLIITEVLVFAFSLWYWNIKLVVKVLDEGIYIKFLMMQFKYKLIEFNQIDTCKAIEYNAIKEFGGWGIKGIKHKKAYTTSGKFGVQLKLKNGNTVLIGTKKPDGLTLAIDKNLNNI